MHRRKLQPESHLDPLRKCPHKENKALGKHKERSQTYQPALQHRPQQGQEIGSDSGALGEARVCQSLASNSACMSRQLGWELLCHVKALPPAFTGHHQRCPAGDTSRVTKSRWHRIIYFWHWLCHITELVVSRTETSSAWQTSDTFSLPSHYQ